MSVAKERLVQQIVELLEADHQLLLQAAKASHAAATHEENVPDSKYETLALEASYIAQGQANRAEEIARAVGAYRKLTLQSFKVDTPIRLSALVELEDEEGKSLRVFLGPAAGGLKLDGDGEQVLVITPESPLGRELLGLRCGEYFEFSGAGHLREYEVVRVE